MSDRHSNIAGIRMLVIGASSGIGQALAHAAHARGARVALAARRVDLLTELAEKLDGSAHELDVASPRAIEEVVSTVAEMFGGLDAIVFTSAVVPFALIEDTDVTTWLHAYAVNAVAASHVLRSALPHLTDNAVALFASSHDVGRPRAGVAAYHASKAALDEILRSWRAEHPELPVIRAVSAPPKTLRSFAEPTGTCWASCTGRGRRRVNPSRDVRGRRRCQRAAVVHRCRSGQPNGGQRNRALCASHGQETRRFRTSSEREGGTTWTLVWAEPPPSSPVAARA